VARAVRADAGPGASPERWIEALNRRLFGFSAEEPGGAPNQSELGIALQWGAGNCMAFSSIYLALAERLALPVHGVKSPGHVFVRWDDGTFRRNIECTEKGAEHPDRWYETRGEGLSIDPADVASGAYLANLSKSEFVALALTNRAFRLADRDEPGAAIAAADAAIRLSPRECSAYIARACAASARGRGARDDVLRDLAAALAIRRPDLHEVGGAVNACRRVGAEAERIAWAERGLGLVPEHAGFLVERAGALIRTGRVADAERDIERIAAGGSNLATAARLRAEALLVSGGDWETALRRGFADDADREDACLDLADFALDGCPARAASAADARRALECARAASEYEFSVREFESAGRGPDRLMSWISRHTARDRNRDRWYELTARCCRAEGDEKGAADAEAKLKGD
jgi:tetratricopeptide (TPR) repeat protein